MKTGSDRPGASSAEFHVLFNGYVKGGSNPAVGRVASTVAFARDGEVRVIIDPGMVPESRNILEPLAALGESAAAITDVIFSHHHPDHTLNAELVGVSKQTVGFWEQGRRYPTLTHVATLQEVLYEELRRVRTREQARRRFMQERRKRQSAQEGK